MSDRAPKCLKTETLADPEPLTVAIIGAAAGNLILEGVKLMVRAYQSSDLTASELDQSHDALDDLSDTLEEARFQVRILRRVAEAANPIRAVPGEEIYVRDSELDRYTKAARKLMNTLRTMEKNVSVLRKIDYAAGAQGELIGGPSVAGQLEQARAQLRTLVASFTSENTVQAVLSQVDACLDSAAAVLNDARQLLE